MTLLILALLFAPQAHADDWFNNIEPNSGPSAMASINYALTTPPGEYPAGAPGMWQVYATPPGVRMPPGPQHVCDVVPYQGAPAPGCPAGWDLWYR